MLDVRFSYTRVCVILRLMQISQKSKIKSKSLSPYRPEEIEAKWQSVWEKEGIYQPDLERAKKPYYNLHMFPYPSAEGLHVGNVYAFTGADIHGRFKRQRGYDVFQPFGLDGFGIHSENYALKIGSHPMEQAEKSEKRFYDQVRSLGSGHDWRHSLETYDPDYYRWTQWIFVQLFKAGLAYRADVKVNWCPSCKTVLADEQVLDGQCERCGSTVEKKDLQQWMFRITEYAEELLDGLKRIDWTEKVKIAQNNWIGKSEGATVRFPVFGSQVLEGSKDLRPTTKDQIIEVFTTRPDTLYGATFLVVSPEHPFVDSLLNLKFEIKNLKIEEVRKYVDQSLQKSEAERLGSKEKTGVFSGEYAINPINNQQIPIWIADYVLMGYGTGAIMAVPGHDQRDFEFAKKFDLPIIQVVEAGVGVKPLKKADKGFHPYLGSGYLINSGDWDGLAIPQEKGKVIESLVEKKIGERFTNYHLRDWLISRQRYWGPPIPMIYCQSCANSGRSWFSSKEAKDREVSGMGYLVFSDKDPNTKYKILNTQMAGWYPEEDLPLKLPFIEDYKPLGTGNSPLGNHPEFYETVCPECGGKARRETDVSDTFLDSAWYFYRYISTDDNSHAWDRKTGERWLPPTIYTGGAEHSVLHLLYARFLTKVFKDLGLVENFDEPFPRFFAHGLIIKDGAKMSKSKGNVVVPDKYIRKFGADTLRSYLMFLGLFSMGGDFRDSGIEGMYRFLKRVWTLVSSFKPLTGEDMGQGLDPTKPMDSSQSFISTDPSTSAKSEMNKAIRGVTEDIEAFHFNTAIAKIMTYYNYLSKKDNFTLDEAKVLLQLLAPFAPHMTEELYQRLMTGDYGSSSESRKSKTKNQKPFESIHTATWPEFDESAIEAGEVVIAVQINGKLRGTFKLLDPLASQEEVERIAHEDPGVRRHLEGKIVHKVIFVPGKILNFVVS